MASANWGICYSVCRINILKLSTGECFIALHRGSHVFKLEIYLNEYYIKKLDSAFVDLSRPSSRPIRLWTVSLVRVRGIEILAARYFSPYSYRRLCLSAQPKFSTNSHKWACLQAIGRLTPSSIWIILQIIRKPNTTVVISAQWSRTPMRNLQH